MNLNRSDGSIGILTHIQFDGKVRLAHFHADGVGNSIRIVLYSSSSTAGGASYQPAVASSTKLVQLVLV